MISKIETQNITALIEQKHKPLLDIIANYQSGKNVAEALDAWQGFGTTGEAIKQYLETNVTQKPKPKRTAKKAGE